MMVDSSPYICSENCSCFLLRLLTPTLRATLPQKIPALPQNIPAQKVPALPQKIPAQKIPALPPTLPQKS